MGKNKGGSNHHHRSGQSKVKKAHNKKKSAGPNQPAPQLLTQQGGKKKNSSASSTNNQQNNAPKLVAFVALHDSANPYLLKTQCLQKILSENGTAAKNAEEILTTKNLPYAPITVSLPPWAQSSSQKGRLF